MAATPIFDAEIVKLRRRLPDLYNEDGAEITTSNVGSSTDTGTAWKRDELVTIYNDAVRSFIGYVTTMFPEEKWYKFIPGYIVVLDNQSLSSGKLTYTALTPPAYYLIDVKAHGTDLTTELGKHITPKQWMEARTGFVKTRKPTSTRIMWTVMQDATNGQRLFVLPANTAAVDLVYVRSHANITHDVTDIDGISNDGFTRIQIFAENEARRYKSVEVKDLSEAALAKMMQADAQLKDK